MICYPCKDGAILMRLGRREAADKAHANCHGDTHCDCQHRTSGSALNPLMITTKLNADDANLRIALGSGG